MGVYKLSGAGGLLTPRVNYTSMLAGNEVFEPSSYHLIASSTIESAQPSVTFNNLDTYAYDYRHLQLRIVSRSTLTSSVEDYLELRFNGVSTSSYTSHTLRGFGDSVGSFNRLNVSSLRVGDATVPSAVATSGSYGFSIVEILDSYSTTKNTTTKAFSGRSDNLSNIQLQSGVFINTSAINSIQIFNTFANHAAGSRFSLYGIRG